MSRAIDRLRLKRHLDNIQIYGEDDSYAQAATYVPTALSAISEIAQKSLAAKSAAEKKKAIDEAQKKLDDARTALKMADAKESDKSGPLHQAAKKAVDDAQSALQALIGPAPGAQGAGAGDAGKGKHGAAGGLPSDWWKWPAIIGGVGVAGLVGYKLFFGRKHGRR